MSNSTVKYIDAKFGGEYIRFDLRNGLVDLENSLNSGAFECFKRLVDGKWSIRDIQLVLSASIPDLHSGFDPMSPEAGLRRMNRGLGSARIPQRVYDSPFVLRILRDTPPARYAVLAMNILEAGLFGIAEDQASFDENQAEAA